MLALSVIKELLRGGQYAWPGGYPQFFVACDGAALSFKAVKKEWRNIVSAHIRHDRRDGWALCGYDVNWEDDSLYCDHTGEKIESAYGETV